MLSLQTVYPDTLELLKALAQAPILGNMRLVGGTALALQYSFERLMQFYLEKYSDGSEYRALLSMTYFGDADLQPMPYMFSDVSWEEIKKRILQEVEEYNRQNC